tara:strand:+ start:57094 stop:57321 length:228 start_codon:yes stop_codon:yes gene_type:complete
MTSVFSVFEILYLRYRKTSFDVSLSPKIDQAITPKNWQVVLRIVANMFPMVILTLWLDVYFKIIMKNSFRTRNRR